ncbi:hypothetical protein [Haloferula sp. A504]|uniref:hypothetical protein n=1 Tax=Haloferula sp. A504 TaxID=3373601 RepID=UPI0037C0E63C
MELRRKKVQQTLMRQGFALVVTVSLMVLLSLLAIGLLSLSSVTLRSSAKQLAQAEARSNARMALVMAVAQLQKQLGPDQRISMTAGQLAKPGSDGEANRAAAGNLHWTGVYDAWSSTSVDRPDPTFRSWIVSGQPNATSELETVETELASSNSIELVGSGTLGTTATGQVKVPAVNLARDGSPGGRLAWWVGDQGVKAALGTPAPAEGDTLAVVRNNIQAAPRNAVELAEVADTRPFSLLATDDPRLPKVTSWQQSAHLVADPDGPRPLFHDLSAFSTGMLTNVRSGGFRKDLSMKMETYTDPPDLSDPENILYTVRSDMTGNDEVGVNFMELWSYYHLYKELNYGGGLNYTTGGNLPSTAPYLQTKRTEDELNTDPWDRLKHPVTINYQTIYSFEADPHPSEAGKYVIWLNFDPVVTLWNPLDVAVDIPRHLVNGSPRWNYLYSFWMIPYDINISINGGPDIRCSILKSSNWKNDGNFLKLNAGVAETLTLKPGEVVKISQDGDLSSDQRGQSVGGWEGFNGKKGFNYGGGARVPLVAETSSLTNAADVDRVVVSPNDTISYSVTPRQRAESGNSPKFALTHVWLNLGGRGGSLQSFMSVDSRVGYSRVQVGEQRRYGQYWGPNPLDIRADEHPEVFPVIDGPSMTRDLPVGALISEKVPFMLHSYFVKTEEENLSGSRTMARFNPRAYSLNFYDLSKRERDMMPFETTTIGMTSWLDAPLDESLSGQGYFGSSLGAEFGSNFVTTHSVPRQPIISLAALQHSCANGFNMPNRGLPCFDGRKPDHTNRIYPLEPQISHAIGNSLAPSVIPPDKTTYNISGYPHPLADHSYLANRELWDDYFLSGIAPQPTPAFSEAKDQETVAREFFGEQKELPTARYLPDLGGRDPEELVDSWFSGGRPTQDSIREVAGYLRVDGMFNVNSTSVEAWKAVLGALKDREVVVRSDSGAETIDDADGDTPVASLFGPFAEIIEDQAAMQPEQWNGRRTLSDDEIDSLARGIVREVRRRGPFLSLADFVNRRIGGDEELARSGAIQSALDSDEVTVNRRQNSGRSVSGATAGRFEFPEAEQGVMHYGAPSIVRQADILTPIAPVLSVRSDSFIIRSYGESVDAGGKVLARAWCEAVVERQSDYIDGADTPETEAADLTEAVNREFGRQFRIVSFRWLNPREV